MPLIIPVILLAATGATALYGAKRGKDGIDGMMEARRIVERAKSRHATHVRLVEQARAQLMQDLERTTEEKKRHSRDVLGRMLELLGRLEQKGSVKDVLLEKGVDVRPEEVAQFRGQYLEAGGLLTGAMKAIGMGANIASAATTLIGTFATASTGVAISGLAGAAAESAVLAWLGGGAIAAGGGGMALGGVVLAGVAIGPAMAVGGLVLAAQGEKARSQAVDYEAKIVKACSEMDAVVALLHRGSTRAEEVCAVLGDLRRRADVALERLSAVIDTFDRSSDVHVSAFARAMLLCKAMSNVIRAPILDENGELHRATEDVLRQAHRAATEES